jgi:LacI family transcriptional regulator
VVDDYKGAFIATTHLIEQGYRKIAHIAGPGHIPIFKQRLEGYKDALKKAGLIFQSELVKTGSVSIESGYRCMNELLQLQDRIDSVFAVEDFTALGALQCLKSNNRKVPEEIGLVGFANEAFGEYITPSLSTINQQTIKMGEATARMFFERMMKNHFYKETPQKLMLEPELIVRESSRRK